MIQEDEKRILTPLGRQQAHLTGKRIAEMMKGAEEKFGPCRIQTMRVSGLTRARETAAIIATHLPGVTLQEPDPLLNEGRYDTLLSENAIQCLLASWSHIIVCRLILCHRPCHTIPGGPASARDIETTDAHHGRIEEAFTKYFFRAPAPDTESQPKDEESVPEKHEFEVIVCHANVIRYYLCRCVPLVLDRIKYTDAHMTHWLVFARSAYGCATNCLQRSTTSSRSVASILSIQLQLDVFDHTSDGYCELPYDGRHWSFALQLLYIFRASWVQLVNSDKSKWTMSRIRRKLFIRNGLVFKGSITFTLCFAGHDARPRIHEHFGCRLAIGNEFVFRSLPSGQPPRVANDAKIGMEALYQFR
jgi:broad specificity phosphatase PhoE